MDSTHDKIELRQHTGKLAENNLHLTERLGNDFREKARSVLAKVSHDYILDQGGSQVYLPVTKDGKKKIFETKVLHMHIKNLQRYVEDGPSVAENGSKYAASVMNAFSGIAHMFPDKIPQYFTDYTVNKDIQIPPNGYYYPDRRIEDWQDGDEKVIIFALELSQNGTPLPENWKTLKTMFESSKVEK